MNAQPCLPPAKTHPLPVRFTAGEDRFLHEAAVSTGLSVSELVRRSVRLMRRHQLRAKSYGFVLDLSA